MPDAEHHQATVLANAGCPICRKTEWTAAPTVLMPKAGLLDTGFGLTVRPFVCNDCGYVALMLAHEQPKEMALEAIRRFNAQG